MARNDSVTFKIKGLPPSSNHAIVQGKNGRRYPSKEYRAWKRAVKAQPIQKIKTSKWYGIEIIIKFNLFYKNGNIRRKDASNYVKYAEDECIKRLETYTGETLDDCLILNGDYHKCDLKKGETESTEVTIYCI